MANGRHSYVAFYPSDWLAGTARLTRMHRSVYFDVCCYNWDTAQPCPPIELAVMLGDLKDGEKLINDLIAMGKLIRNADGSVENAKAMAEAQKALAAWAAMSRGGRGKVKGGSQPPSQGGSQGASMGDGIEPEPEPEPEPNISEEEEGDVSKIVSAWNSMAKASGLSCVLKLTDQRRRKATARVRDYGAVQIMEAIGEVPKRTFLMGQGKSGWTADFDWLLRPDTVAKIMEGRYGNADRKSGWAWVHDN